MSKTENSTIDELLISIGIDADKKSFDEFNGLMSGVKSLMTSTAALAGGWGLTNAMTDLARVNVGLNEFSKAMNISLNDVLRLQHAFGSLGLSANNALSIIQKARTWMYQSKFSALPDDMITAFTLTGEGDVTGKISNMNDPMQVVNYVADVYSRMKQNERDRFSGLTNDERYFLSKDAKWRNQQYTDHDKRVSETTQNDIKRYEELLKGTNNIESTLGGMKDAALLLMIPKLTSMIENLDNWLIANRKDIVESAEKSLPFLQTMAIGITALAAKSGIKGVLTGKTGKLLRGGGLAYLYGSLLEYWWGDKDSIIASTKSSIDFNFGQIKSAYNKFMGIKEPRGPGRDPKLFDIPGYLEDLPQVDPAMYNILSQKFPGLSESELQAFLFASEEYGVPLTDLLAIGWQESVFDENALGREVLKDGTRAQGIMQYRKSTADKLGIDPFNPLEAISAAARQLSERLRIGESREDAIKHHFGGTNKSNWKEKTEKYYIDINKKSQYIRNLLDSYNSPVGDRQSFKTEKKITINAPIEVKIDATGMTPEEAKKIVDEHVSNNINQALLSSGADYR